MYKYILKRLLMMIPVLLGVTFIVFFILNLSPGDPAAMILGDQASEEALEMKREELGLNDPLLVRYGRYVVNMVQGDLGTSYKNDLSVWDQVMERFPNTAVLAVAGILVAILLAIAMYILMTKTTLGYELQACGANRHAARYAGIKDKRNIVLSMAIAGALAGAGAALYYLSGNTEFYWSTYQSLPAVGFNGIPVALLALNNPIAVIFAGVFMAMLKIVGQQLTNLTAYNEYITDVIIAVIVYLSAFSLVIRMMLSGRKKKKIAVADTAPIPQGAAVEDQTSLLPEEEKAPVEAAVTDSDNAEGGDQA